MSTYHFSLTKGNTFLNGILDVVFADYQCEVAELLEFYSKPFMSVPVEALWLPYDTSFFESSTISCFVYDALTYERLLEFVGTCAIEQDHMLNYIEEDATDTVIGLSIYVSLCRTTQIRLINKEMDEMRKEVSKAKAMIEEMSVKLVEAQNEITTLKTTASRLERRNRRRRRQSTSSST